MAQDLIMRLSLQNSELRSRLAQSTAQINRFSRDAEIRARGVQSAFDSIGRSLGAMGLAMGFAELSRQVFNTNVQFEKSISSLRSLTGLSGKELDYLKQQAIELGSTTTQSASQVAEAFRIIGSKQPELLKSKEALSTVTKYAIVLAEAAGIEVTEAAIALTGSLNQMGKGASYAEEYINILAAASQKGAADIPYLNSAIENCGGTAATLGINFTQMVSAIEAIAPKFTDAGSAGTYLRNIFLKLEASSDKNLKPSIVGLDKAIENLSIKGWDATKMTEEFGLINVTAAMALVNAKDSYKGFVSEIEGSNTAFEQQKINNDNVAGAINSFKSAWEGLILSLQSGNGILKNGIDYLTELINKFNEFTNPYDTGKAELKDKLKEQYKNHIAQKTEEYIQLGLTEATARTRATKDIIKQLEKDAFAAQSKADWTKRNTKTTGADNVYNAYKSGKTIFSPLERGMLHGSISNDKSLAHWEAMKDILPEVANEYKALIKPIEKVEQKIQPNPTKTNSKKELSDKEKWFNSTMEDGNYIANQAMFGKSLVEGIEEELAKKGVAIHIPIMIMDNPEDVEELENSPVFKEMGNTDTLDYLVTINALMGNIASATNNATSAWLNYSAGIIAQVTTLLPLLASVFKIQSMAAIAEQAKLPFPLNVIAMGGTVAALAATVMNIPKFENGGIVGGNSFYGDNVIARVNSGEMILNNGQQNNLFKLLNGSGSNSYSSSEVLFRISGSDLVGTLNNYGKKKGKVL